MSRDIRNMPGCNRHGRGHLNRKAWDNIIFSKAAGRHESRCRGPRYGYTMTSRLYGSITVFSEDEVQSTNRSSTLRYYESDVRSSWGMLCLDKNYFVGRPIVLSTNHNYSFTMRDNNSEVPTVI